MTSRIWIRMLQNISLLIVCRIFRSSLCRIPQQSHQIQHLILWHILQSCVSQVLPTLLCNFWLVSYSTIVHNYARKIRFYFISHPSETTNNFKKITLLRVNMVFLRMWTQFITLSHFIINYSLNRFATLDLIALFKR